MTALEYCVSDESSGRCLSLLVHNIISRLDLHHSPATDDSSSPASCWLVFYHSVINVSSM